MTYVIDYKRINIIYTFFPLYFYIFQLIFPSLKSPFQGLPALGMYITEIHLYKHHFIINLKLNNTL